MSLHTCEVTKNFNIEAVAVAPPSPPPLPPAKKPKQGIGSILGSDSDHRRAKKPPCAGAATSIRRTLSADMSSKNWLSHMNKISSSADLPDDHHDHSFSGEEDDLINRPGQDEIWRAIQAQQHKLHQNDQDDHHHIKPTLRSCESWSSILLSQKTEDPSKLPPPYIHPLMKRTTSSLSEKSLEICTESLGSETGSDCFSSNSPSESGDEEDNEKYHDPPIIHQEREIEDHNYDFSQYKNSSIKKSAAPRSFPPPLPSLARNKASVQVLSKRQNGRLILEAVPVPPTDYLHAERHDGRLLLTLVGSQEGNHEETGETEKTEETGETEEVFDNFGEEGEKKEIQELARGMGNLEMRIRFPPFMEQFPGLNFKKNTVWTNKKAVAEAEDEENLIVAPLLPPPHSALHPPPGVAGLIHAPPPAATAFVNPYHYFWRKNPTVASVIDIEQCKGTTTTEYLISSNKNDNIVGKNPKFGAKYEQKESVVIFRGSNANNMIPMLRGCKEPRRSVLLWEPFCIATT